MRILFISYELPPIGGGGGRAVWQIARRLAARGHRAAVLTSVFQGLRSFEEMEGVEIHRIRVRRKSAGACPPSEMLSVMLRSVPAAVRVACEFRPSVVCAFFGVPGGPAAWWLKRSCGLPYVLSLRGSDVPRPQLARYQRLHRMTRPFLRRLYRDAAAVVAVSGALRDAANRVTPGLPIRVIPNGVDPAVFRSRQEKRDAATEKHVLFVGRLQEFKGVQHLIRALPIVEAELDARVRLTIVGAGPFLTRLESLADRIKSQGTRWHVQFTGWLDTDQVRTFYESAAVLVLPSLVEGHPNVILEAMAMGVPCVATDVPGTNEILQDGCQGFLVRPEAPQAIADAILKVLSDDGRRRAMSNAARTRAEQFSWDRVASEYEDVLLQVEKKPCVI